ncbi:hypothetical protein, partial [Ideonella sp.]|uniref:hypothetical protein n=1 Tax=Ideonella sp. TaxID=1929293 RepID=UPI003BB77C35
MDRQAVLANGAAFACGHGRAVRPLTVFACQFIKLLAAIRRPITLLDWMPSNHQIHQGSHHDPQSTSRDIAGRCGQSHA